MKSNLPTYSVFLGVGGIGMSALARYFNQQGISVWGYDKTPSAITDALEVEGIKVCFDDKVEEIPKACLQNQAETWVIYTPAIPEDSALRTYFSGVNIRMMKRASLLGELSKGMDTFAIAGTHGKTTCTTLAAWVLKNSDVGGNAFLGGISGNFHSNLLVDTNSNKLAVEADEFDRSFLTLSPNVALITATDPDHLDIYKTQKEFLDTFKAFSELVDDNGILVCNEEVEIDLPKKGKNYSYGWKATNDFYPTNCVYHIGKTQFDLVTPMETIKGLVLSMPGKHNVINAVGVAAVMLQWGITAEEMKQAFETFKGIKRRFEVIAKWDNGIYIDDYAHHPKELKAAISSAKEIFPGKKITGVFQPHLFSRTKDFADEFGNALSLLDELFLMDIYPARELPIAGVDSEWLLGKVAIANKHLVGKEELVSKVSSSKPEVLLTLGAGDIDRMVAPLKEALTI